MTSESKVIVTSSEQSPSSVIIDAPKAWLTFKSGSYGTRSGFKLHIEEIPIHGNILGNRGLYSNYLEFVAKLNLI